MCCVGRSSVRERLTRLLIVRSVDNRMDSVWVTRRCRVLPQECKSATNGLKKRHRVERTVHAYVQTKYNRRCVRRVQVRVADACHHTVTHVRMDRERERERDLPRVLCQEYRSYSIVFRVLLLKVLNKREYLHEVGVGECGVVWSSFHDSRHTRRRMPCKTLHVKNVKGCMA